MAQYVVLEPSDSKDAEKAVFVRDGFHVLALVLPFVWLLTQRLWFEAFAVLGITILLGLVGAYFGIADAVPLLTLLVSLFVALEGVNWKITKLGRQGFVEKAVIDASDLEEAEIRYFYSLEDAAGQQPLLRTSLLRNGRSSPSSHLFLIWLDDRVCRPSRRELKMRVAIIDYGSGNLRSATKAFERAAHESGIAAEIELTADADRVATADRIVLPGVGAYADCRRGLHAVPGMVEALEDVVLKKAHPFLGICVGMQLMSERGLEKEVTEGLGWIAGDVREMTPSDPSLKIPQIGWNRIHVKHSHPVFEGIETGENGLHAYFVHSYMFDAKNKADVLAVTEYGGDVTATVGRDNMVGTQFHPEKSQLLGLSLIANFLKWKP